MKEADLILLLSAARQLHNDGHRQLAIAVNDAISELTLEAIGRDYVIDFVAAARRMNETGQGEHGGTPADPLPAWEDPRVQIVYTLLCADEAPPDREEHWEGWIARRIVAALAIKPAVTAESLREGLTPASNPRTPFPINVQFNNAEEVAAFVREHAQRGAALTDEQIYAIFDKTDPDANGMTVPFARAILALSPEGAAKPGVITEDFVDGQWRKHQ